MILGPLIPVKRGRKGTYLNDWQNLTPEQLEKEVAMNNGGNVALRLDHFASLDPDTVEAREVVELWVREGIVGRTVAWRTASGAVRRLFKAPPGLKRMQDETIKLDLRHGNQFNDIIPPSFVVDVKKGLRGSYVWLPGCSPEEIEPAALPQEVIQYFINLLPTLNAHPRARECKSDAYVNLWRGVSEPGRNETGTKLAGRLLSRGLPYEEVVEIIMAWNNLNQPPMPEKEVFSLVMSIQKSEFKKFLETDRKISEEVREWVLTTNGNFLTTNVHTELCLTTLDHKKAANMALLRLRDEGAIVECGTKRGCYRTIQHEAPEIEWIEARTDRVYSLKWPFELEKLVNIYPKNIVVVAGAPNAGKTAFMLNLVRLNLDDAKIHFLSSEMGPEELNLRITKFEDYTAKFWKRFRPRERARDFADAIKPNAVNIIDYFEISDNFYQIGAELRTIHDRLRDGVAIIAMQKKKGAELGRGAEFSLEKPRLYISMEPGELTIVKGKNWAQPGINPNNMKFKFKLIDGCRFLEYE